ncbi:MAG: hypothetical protein MJY91_07675 [Bacteroidales bacterium]|nr:hypothetical protein [Bacteroidales bacterium]
MRLPLRGVATPGHGEGEGSAGDKFRVSGTQETVEGAGANVPGAPQIIDLWGGAVSGALS